MVNDAERFADEDKKVKERVDAKNELESYAYNLRNQLKDDDKLGGKLDESDKTTITEAVDETVEWLDSNGSTATTEELKAKKTAFEKIVNPIVSKLYQGGAGGAPPSGEDDEGHDEF